MAGERYRVDVDGLRAFAVLAVIVNHADQHALRAGFLGVDVFFVISGFVITRSLLGQPMQSLGKFLGGFYLRRFKRLVPALVLMVATTFLVLSRIDPEPRASLNTGLFSLAGLANIYLWLQALDYFSADVSFNAFMHTWSLGVEEQFYLIVPTLIWFGSRLSRDGTTRLMTKMLVVLSLVSLVLFLALNGRHPLSTFYMLHTRFWELGVGVLLAALPHRRFEPQDAPPRWIGRQTGALVFLVAVFALPELDARWLIPLAVAGTVGIIAAPDRSPLLTNGTVVYLGTISYALYLWHWPLLVFRRLAPHAELTSVGVLLVLLLAAAIASHHLVETPLRQKNWVGNKRAMLTGLSTFALCGAIGGYGFHAPGAQAVTSTLSSESRGYVLAPAFAPLPNGKVHNPTCVVDDNARPLHPETFADCTFPPLPGKETRTIWAMGDSHAGALQALLVELHEDTGIGFHLVETPGQAFPSLPGPASKSRQSLSKEALEKTKPGDIVLLSRLWLSRTNPVKTQGGLMDNWFPMLPGLVREMEDRGVTVVIAGPSPMYQFADVRECLGSSFDGCTISRDEIAPLIDSIYRELDVLAKAHPNVKVFNLFDELCPPTQNRCYPGVDGRLTMRDRDHVNVFGAKRLEESFMELVGIKFATR